MRQQLSTCPPQALALPTFVNVSGSSPRTCAKCGATKPISEFYRQREGHRYSCKTCDAARHKLNRQPAPMRARPRATEAEYQRRYRAKHRAKDLVRHARKRASDRNLPFDLNLWLPAIQARIDAGVCEMTGVPFNLNEGRTFDSPSLDRRDPGQGYVYSNIRVICHAMNGALGDWGEDKLRVVMLAWLAR